VLEYSTSIIEQFNRREARRRKTIRLEYCLTRAVVKGGRSATKTFPTEKLRKTALSQNLYRLPPEKKSGGGPEGNENKGIHNQHRFLTERKKKIMKQSTSHHYPERSKGERKIKRGDGCENEIKVNI